MEHDNKETQANRLTFIAALGVALLLMGIYASLFVESRTVPKGTTCDDGGPAVAMSAVGREAEDGTAVWFPDDPPLYHICP